MHRYFQKHGVDVAKVNVKNVAPTETAPALFRFERVAV